MKTEAWLSKRIRSGWPAYGLAQTFESCGQQGVPDLMLALPCLGSVWVELKQVPTPASTIPFRAGQPQWLSRAVSAGMKIYILAIIQCTSEAWLLPVQKENYKTILGQVPHKSPLSELKKWGLVKVEIPLASPSIAEELLKWF